MERSQVEDQFGPQMTPIVLEAVAVAGDRFDLAFEVMASGIEDITHKPHLVPSHGNPVGKETLAVDQEDQLAHETKEPLRLWPRGHVDGAFGCRSDGRTTDDDVPHQINRRLVELGEITACDLGAQVGGVGEEGEAHGSAAPV